MTNLSYKLEIKEVNLKNTCYIQFFKIKIIKKIVFLMFLNVFYRKNKIILQKIKINKKKNVKNNQNFIF